jgi:hypothetical protein
MMPCTLVLGAAVWFATAAAQDPPRFLVRPVPGNVAVVLNYYQQTDILGRGVVSTAPGFKGRITRSNAMSRIS